MSDDVTTTNGVAAHRAGIALASGVVGVILAATIALWAHYGTAVFFETIRTGLVACFG